MSNMLRKIKSHSLLEFRMNLKTGCPKCRNTKLTSQDIFPKRSGEEYQEGKIFLFEKCKKRMNSVFTKLQKIDIIAVFTTM